MGGEAGGQPCEGQQRGLTLRNKKEKKEEKKTLIIESCSTNAAILFSTFKQWLSLSETAKIK